MGTLHIFNPSHDEALAAGTPSYTPARAAGILEADIAPLPAWWGEAGDDVLVWDAERAGLEINGCRTVSLDSFRHRPELWQNIAGIAPWGWDERLVRLLLKAGVPQRLVPAPERLWQIRRLSSRQTAVGLLQAVRRDVPESIGNSCWCATPEDIAAAVAGYGQAVLKAPWSGSGRGVFRTVPDPAAATRRARHILQRQGGIEAEPFYRRRQDLALEFLADAEGVRCTGISVFFTAPGGGYTGNLVADDTLLWHWVPREIRPALSAARDSLCRHLATLFQDVYCGPVGIDMMVVDTADGLRLHPCVEMNLRQTMGWAAIRLRRLVARGGIRLLALRPVPGAGGREAGDICLTPRAGSIEAMLLAKAPAVRHEAKQS